MTTRTTRLCIVRHGETAWNFEERWQGQTDVALNPRGQLQAVQMAARLAKDCIKKVEQLEYQELGMEAVWRIEVLDFPAFILIDDKGNDFFVNTCGICVPAKT